MSASTTTRWHPGTKLLLLGAALAIPYLLWTGEDSGSPAIVAAVDRAGEAGAAAPAADPGAPAPPGAAASPGPRALPTLQTFAAVVERPLFAPTRRFIRPVGPPAQEAEPEIPEEAPAEVAEASSPERPDLRFFGTIRRGAKVAALVTGGEGGDGIERLEVGDAVGDWQVSDVTRDRLVLVHEKAEAAEYAIFSGGAAAPPPPPPAESTDGPEEAGPEAGAEIKARDRARARAKSRADAKFDEDDYRD